jgi:hypothetical protein
MVGAAELSSNDRLDRATNRLTFFPTLRLCGEKSSLRLLHVSGLKNRCGQGWPGIWSYTAREAIVAV